MRKTEVPAAPGRLINALARIGYDTEVALCDLIDTRSTLEVARLTSRCFLSSTKKLVEQTRSTNTSLLTMGVGWITTPLWMLLRLVAHENI